MVGNDTRVKGNEPDKLAKSWRQKLLEMESDLISDPEERHSKCMNQVFKVAKLKIVRMLGSMIPSGGSICQDLEGESRGSIETGHSSRVG